MVKSFNPAAGFRQFTNSKSKISIVFLFLFSAILFHSCAYSVIVFETQAVPETDMANNELGFYANKQVHKIDTIARLRIEAKQLMITPTCEAPGLYSVEYKITFWDLLRNTFTFGKRQRANIKYVCIKPGS